MLIDWCLNPLVVAPASSLSPLFLGWAFRATAYNFVHSQNVSEMCQFYTVDANSTSFAQCSPACLGQGADDDTLKFQYALRLPGAGGGVPGSCQWASKCKNLNDELMCCSNGSIAYYNATSPRPTNKSIANTCAANFDAVLNLFLTCKKKEKKEKKSVYHGGCAALHAPCDAVCSVPVPNRMLTWC